MGRIRRAIRAEPALELAKEAHGLAIRLATPAEAPRELDGVALEIGGRRAARFGRRRLRPRAVGNGSSGRVDHGGGALGARERATRNRGHQQSPRMFACTPCVRGDDESGRASAFAANMARGPKPVHFTLDERSQLSDR